MYIVMCHVRFWRIISLKCCVLRLVTSVISVGFLRIVVFVWHTSFMVIVLVPFMLCLQLEDWRIPNLFHLWKIFPLSRSCEMQASLPLLTLAELTQIRSLTPSPNIPCRPTTRRRWRTGSKTSRRHPSRSSPSSDTEEPAATPAPRQSQPGKCLISKIENCRHFGKSFPLRLWLSQCKPSAAMRDHT